MTLKTAQPSCVQFWRRLKITMRSKTTGAPSRPRRDVATVLLDACDEHEIYTDESSHYRVQTSTLVAIYISSLVIVFVVFCVGGGKCIP